MHRFEHTWSNIAQTGTGCSHPLPVATRSSKSICLTARADYVLVSFVTHAASSGATTLSDRFSAIIEGLCRAVASRAAASPTLAPLLLIVWSRLRRMTRRFASLAGRVAGRVGGRITVGSPRRDGDGPRPSEQRERLPRGFGWLVRLVPEAGSHGAQLQGLLSEPGMAELLAVAPQAKRVLRPLCRMLAVTPSPELLPPAARQRSRRDAGDAVARGAVRARRVRVPREAGLAWLRWRPAEGVG